jgi:transposase
MVWDSGHDSADEGAGYLFAGVDWGGSFHQLCVLTATGAVVVQQRIEHDVVGLRLLGSKLVELGGPVKVAIERAEGLLVEFLHTLPEVTLYCVSPKISARARERYRLSASKSDTFDAFVLADTVRHEHARWRPLSCPSSLTAQLQAVSRDRARVLHAKVACESRLRAVLETYHPAPLHLFSELDRDISLEFIRAYPTPDQARRVKTARMAAFCARQHYSGAAPTPRSWSTGSPRTCCRPARAPPPVSRSPLDCSPRSCGCTQLICGPSTSRSTSCSKHTPMHRSSCPSQASDRSWQRR